MIKYNRTWGFCKNVQPSWHICGYRDRIFPINRFEAYIANEFEISCGSRSLWIFKCRQVYA